MSLTQINTKQIFHLCLSLTA